MQIDQFSVVEPGRIEVQKADLNEKVQPWEVLVETEYSIVSGGTEGALREVAMPRGGPSDDSDCTV